MEQSFIQFTNVSLAFGDRDILRNASLFLKTGSKAALCGVNGSGKSTLLKIIAGEIAPDHGERAVEKDCRVAYLPQSGIVHQGRSLREELESAYAEQTALLDKAAALAAALAAESEDSRRTRALLAAQHELQESVEQSGYYTREREISQTLSGLGFAPADAERPCEAFSGGWQMRIALAKALLRKPDILLLDEPTNYLDIEARSWLEAWLSRFRGGYLLVSHDRYFLDVSVNEVYELFQGQLKRYSGNYSAYEKTRAAELSALEKRCAAQEAEEARLEALIERFRYKASKAAFAQEQVKKLEKLRESAIVLPESLKRISVTLPPAPHSGKIALTVKDLRKSYPEKAGGSLLVLPGLDLVLEAGERLVVAGPNGAGKSTLLRILAGEDRDYQGSVTLGAGVSAGYFSQDSAETLRGAESVLDFLEREAGRARAETGPLPLRDLLGAFLFRGDDVYKALDVLSGGEKSRLSLLRMLLRPLNLMLLDEPTNHLDLTSKDILLDALRSYSGTIVFVSHDRAFMEALSTKTLGLAAGQPPRLYYGNYAYYLERKESEEAALQTASSHKPGAFSRPKETPRKPGFQLQSGAEPVQTAPDSASIPCASCAIPAPSPGAKERREEAKRREAERRRLEREEAALLSRIDTLEKRKASLEEELSKPEVYSNPAKSRAAAREITSLEEEIQAATACWEQLATG